MGQEFIIPDGLKELLEFQKERIQKSFDVRIALVDLLRPNFVGVRDYSDSVGTSETGAFGDTMVAINGQNPEMCIKAMVIY